MRHINNFFSDIMAGVERRFKHTTPQFVMLLLALVGIYFVVGFANEVVHAQQLQVQINQTEAESQQIEQRNARLREQVEYHKSDAYVEQAARDLNMRKPDDTIIIPILPTPGPQPANPAAPGTAPLPATSDPDPTRPNWQRWVNLFTQ